MHPLDRPRPLFHLAHARLHSLALRALGQYASISEMASAAACDTTTVIEAFGPYVENGTVRLELVEDEVFILTGAGNRPIPRHLPDVPVSQWEMLRRHLSPEQAYLHWALTRGLEACGWETECATPAVSAGLSRIPGAPNPVLGVYVGNHVVPVVAYPSAAQATSGSGPLETYERAGAPCVALLVREGGLDPMITAIRQWAMTRRVRPGMSVLVLEAPRFDPTMVTASDPAVPHRAVDRLTLASWDLN
jgi:hypothetical protein